MTVVCIHAARVERSEEQMKMKLCDFKPRQKARFKGLDGAAVDSALLRTAWQAAEHDLDCLYAKYLDLLIRHGDHITEKVPQ